MYFELTIHVFLTDHIDTNKQPVSQAFTFKEQECQHSKMCRLPYPYEGPLS